MGQGLPDPTSAPDVDSRLWSDAVSRTLLAERVVPGLRIPGADGYLSDLAKGRVAAAGGEAPEKALASRRQGLDRAHQSPRAQASALALPSQPQQPGHAPAASGTREISKGATVDDTEESPPTLNADIETEVKELMGLFDLPAFARRGQDLEITLRRCTTAAARRAASCSTWSSFGSASGRAPSTGPTPGRRVFTGRSSRSGRSPRPSRRSGPSSPAPIRRQRIIARDLIAAVLRFNRRWTQFLDRLNLEPANPVIDQYNRYYVLEKECVMGSARLAARHFINRAALTTRCCLTTIPRCPFPSCSIDRAGLDRG